MCDYRVLSLLVIRVRFLYVYSQGDLSYESVIVRVDSNCRVSGLFELIL